MSRLHGEARPRAVSDDQVYRQFMKWTSAKDRLAKKASTLSKTGGSLGGGGGGGLDPLPQTPLFATSFQSLGSRSRLVGERREAPEPEFVTHAAARERARRRGDAPPFFNSFERPREEALALDRERAAAAAAAAKLAESERDRAALALRAAQQQAKARPKTPEAREAAAAPAHAEGAAGAPGDDDAASRRRRPSFGSASTKASSVADPALLQPRLEKIWFDLRLPMVQKLQFLQKYASVQHAPLLPRAVEIWGVAADVYVKRAKLIGLRDRLGDGELFAAADFVALAGKALAPGDPPRPEVLDDANGIINTPTGDYGAVGRAAADAWLAACVELYTSRCLESADAADRELGDALPDLKTFLPPRPAPKEQTPKEGDKAAK